MSIMKKKGGQLLRLARNALEKSGANPVMAEAAAHPKMVCDRGARHFASEEKLRAEGIDIADDLLANIERRAAG